MGRDVPLCLTVLLFLSFNPRARVGRDGNLGDASALDRVSIHAPAWGATCPAVRTIGFFIGFNPRARVGRDDRVSSAATDDCVSIHAPAWGATVGCGDYQIDPQVSIHAPAWGATPAPPQHGGGAWFQSTRPRGARPQRLSRAVARVLVSIHAPAWGAT